MINAELALHLVCNSALIKYAGTPWPVGGWDTRTLTRHRATTRLARMHAHRR
ncbi:MAG: hypothetical protein ACRDVG_15520 [Jatrophihabitantaceae bacterium]